MVRLLEFVSTRSRMLPLTWVDWSINIIGQESMKTKSQKVLDGVRLRRVYRNVYLVG